jgi:2-haloacid dehalogenase
LYSRRKNDGSFLEAAHRKTMQSVLVFDLNGTLTDLSVLDPQFQSAFGSADIRREWFNEMIQLSMASTMTGHYVEFPKLAKAALDAVAARYTVRLSPEAEAAIVAGTRTAPPFPDVQPALERLRGAGYRMAVLTNSTLSSAEAVLRNAGIYVYFERVLSVDSIRTYKPSPEVYRYGASELRIPPSSMLMIAAHAWDTTGALRAGCEAAFLARPFEVLDSLAPRPRLVAADLGALTTQLLESDGLAKVAGI